MSATKAEMPATEAEMYTPATEAEMYAPHAQPAQTNSHWLMSGTLRQGMMIEHLWRFQLHIQDIAKASLKQEDCVSVDTLSMRIRKGIASIALQLQVLKFQVCHHLSL